MKKKLLTCVAVVLILFIGIVGYTTFHPVKVEKHNLQELSLDIYAYYRSYDGDLESQTTICFDDDVYKYESGLDRIHKTTGTPYVKIYTYRSIFGKETKKIKCYVPKNSIYYTN